MPQVNGNVTRLDELMGDMMDELIKRNLHKCIDIIITSDHGQYIDIFDLNVNML